MKNNMAKKYRKPHRFKKKKPIYRHRFFWLGLLILIFLLSTFYFLFFSKTFQVKKINLVGREQVSEEELNLLVKSKLEDRILFFPAGNIFLLNLNKIKEDVLQKFHRLAEIEIYRHFPDSLNILIRERKELAVFCQEKNCFVLDKEGIVFEEKPIDRAIQPLIKSLILSSEIGLGDKVIEKEDLISLLEINSQLKEGLNIPVKEFIIFSEEKLIAVTQAGWELYFNLQTDVKWQLTKLKALLEEKIPEEERINLEYIELRFGNFANPKYKD